MQSTEQDVAIRITGLTKEYRLGQIGGQTLQNELKSRWALMRGKEDPNAKLFDSPGSSNKKLKALDGVDLVVHKGETLGIIGRNGAGKSTLLKIISRITAPTSGSVELYGRVASMLEVGTGFHGELTGRENIYMNGAILGMTKAEMNRKMEEIIEFSEVREFIDTPVKRYSSGMYVKLGFSIAAHLDSEIMIMDEVLAVGDMEFQSKCLNKMRAAAQKEGRTVLYVSHNMNTIRHLCRRCIVMDAGRIVFDGDVDKAIAIYLGMEETTQKIYTFDENYRPYDSSLRMNKRFEMKKLAFAKDANTFFSSTQKQYFTIECVAMKPLNRVGFRFELWYQDGTKVGTMLSGSFVDFEKGTQTVNVCFDPEHLTPGQYQADIVAYQFDEDGNEDILDGVYPGVIFQIKEQLGVVSYLDWHHQYWGHIQLHNLEVSKR